MKSSPSKQRAALFSLARYAFIEIDFFKKLGRWDDRRRSAKEKDQTHNLAELFDRRSVLKGQTAVSVDRRRHPSGAAQREDDKLAILARNNRVLFVAVQVRFLYKGIIINHNKKLSQPTLKRRFFKKKAAFFSWPGLGKEWC